MCAQVLPPSRLLYTPSPQATELREEASPVPTYTMSGFDGATATAPRETVFSRSKTGLKVVPALTVLKSPPLPVAT